MCGLGTMQEPCRAMDVGCPWRMQQVYSPGLAAPGLQQAAHDGLIATQNAWQMAVHCPFSGMQHARTALAAQHSGQGWTTGTTCHAL
jgi:hypothetical protein